MGFFFQALLLQGGFNTALVSVGSAVLGASAGAIGAFVFLRKRSLVSDAISHATLPGLVAAFILMALLGGEGRYLPGLLLGAALSAALGLLLVNAVVSCTRLTEDAAIGAVLSVFFGFGIVLLTVVQSLQTGGQAGLESFLLGSTASMLRSEAETIALAAALVGVAVFLLRRPFTLVSFDPAYAATRGLNVRLLDLAMMALLLLVTVIGLRVAGLVLIVALTIIPPVTARFWTEHPGRMVAIAAALGALSAYLGAVISSLDAALPTGALIVLVAFTLFALSLAFSPARGLVSERVRSKRMEEAVLLRQGLIALAEGRAPADRRTRRTLERSAFIDRSGAPTQAGREASARARREEELYELFRRRHPEEAARIGPSVEPLATLLGPRRYAELEAALPPRPASEAR